MHLNVWNQVQFVGQTDGSWAVWMFCCFVSTLLPMFADPESVQKINQALNDCVFNKGCLAAK